MLCSLLLSLISVQGDGKAAIVGSVVGGVVGGVIGSAAGPPGATVGAKAGAAVVGAVVGVVSVWQLLSSNYVPDPPQHNNYVIHQSHTLFYPIHRLLGCSEAEQISTVYVHVALKSIFHHSMYIQHT